MSNGTAGNGTAGNGTAGNRFAGKVALITGAGSGIGREVSLQLASEGAQVFGVDINAAALDAVEGRVGADRYRGGPRLGLLPGGQRGADGVPAVQPAHPARVDPVGRTGQVGGHGQVGGREAELAAPVVTVTEAVSL